MLAYVFWHHPRAGAGIEGYERALLSLHDRLQAAGAVADSVTFRIRGVLWANEGRPAYEDWYVVDDWTALGALNKSAVSADRKAPHDAVAQSYESGSGAVYELRSGIAGIREAASVQWIAKPRGLAYAAFDELLAPSTDRGALWRRQMVLGPGTEFCLTGERWAALPAPLEGIAVKRMLVREPAP